MNMKAFSPGQLLMMPNMPIARTSIFSRIDLPVEAGQESGRFWELMYDSVYDESHVQDRREP